MGPRSCAFQQISWQQAAAPHGTISRSSRRQALRDDRRFATTGASRRQALRDDRRFAAAGASRRQALRDDRRFTATRASPRRAPPRIVRERMLANPRGAHLTTGARSDEFTSAHAAARAVSSRKEDGCPPRAMLGGSAACACRRPLPSVALRAPREGPVLGVSAPGAAAQTFTACNGSERRSRNAVSGPTSSHCSTV
jgi:hypothetical protein